MHRALERPIEVLMKTDIVLKTIVLNTEGKMLLLRRSDTDDRRPLQWDFPGGLLDSGESLEQGAAREVAEESGIELSSVKAFYSKSGKGQWTDGHGEHQRNVVRIYFSGQTEKSEVKLSYEHSEFKWVSFEEALETIEYHRHKEVIGYILDNKLEL